jgi:hypothetical protein
MDAIDQPAWLKIMQNGSVGEARTKAFLLDRFWVLERSVDIDGADFLVQPRALGARFTDRSPPKIGVVQAKYFQDGRTVHHIPQTYVLDEHGLPLNGFFAVLHVGADDNAKIYMLSAAEIAQTLDRDGETPSRFVVGSKALVDRFRVDQHRRQALDRIEHAINARTLTQSIHFYDRVNIPLYRFTADDIAYRYKLPIPNSQADIPTTYLEYREHLKFLTYEIEEGLTIIDKIMQEPDPRAALVERGNLEEYRSGRGWSDGLTFSTRKLDLDWPYLVEALDEHDARIAALKAVGMLEAYVDLSHAVQREALRLTADIDPAGAAGKYLWMRFDYDSTTLAFGRLLLTLKTSEPGASKLQIDGFAYLHSSKGKVDIVQATHGLWHRLMTVILFDLCPELEEDE